MEIPNVISNTLNLHLSYKREVQDLVANGYSFLFDSDINTSQVTKMKHCKSGRILTLILTKEYWCIRENGRVIKMVKPIRRSGF